MIINKKTIEMTRTYAFILIIKYISPIDNIEYNFFTSLQKEKEQEYAYIVMDEIKQCIDECIRYGDFLSGSIEHVHGDKFKIIYKTNKPYTVMKREFIMSCFEYYDNDKEKPLFLNDIPYFSSVEILHEVPT